MDSNVDATFFALNLALVISYSRPFLPSKQGTTAPATATLPRGVLKVLSGDERRLHSTILRLRSAEFAHSDAESYQVVTELEPNGGMITFVKFTQLPLSYSDLEALQAMLDKFLVEILRRQNHLAERLGTGEF